LVDILALANRFGTHQTKILVLQFVGIKEHPNWFHQLHVTFFFLLLWHRWELDFGGLEHCPLLVHWGYHEILQAQTLYQLRNLCLKLIHVIISLCWPHDILLLGLHLPWIIHTKFSITNVRSSRLPVEPVLGYLCQFCQLWAF